MFVESKRHILTVIVSIFLMLHFLHSLLCLLYLTTTVSSILHFNFFAGSYKSDSE